MATHADDEAVLRALLRAVHRDVPAGSWETLEPVLSDSFAYLDGGTGDVCPHERYVDNLRANPSPALQIDQVVVHVAGDTTVVSARTSRGRGPYGRYVDTYARRGDGWECVHACVWPLPAFVARRQEPERMS